MKSLCSYCEFKNHCSADEKRNCELLEDCDFFERREEREKSKKRRQVNDKR